MTITYVTKDTLIASWSGTCVDPYEMTFTSHWPYDLTYVAKGTTVAIGTRARERVDPVDTRGTVETLVRVTVVDVAWAEKKYKKKKNIFVNCFNRAKRTFWITIELVFYWLIMGHSRRRRLLEKVIL